MVKPLIHKLEQFEKLSDGEKRVLTDAIEDVIELGTRQDINSEGEKAGFVHLLLEGLAARYKILPEGKRHIMAILIPGDLCDIHITLLGQMDHSIGTLSPCKIAYIPRVGPVI